MVRTGRNESVPLSEVQVPDMWGLSRAVVRTGECLSDARGVEVLSSGHAENVLEALLRDAPLQDGEKAARVIVEVWHLANSTTRALQLVEERIQQALRFMEVSGTSSPLVARLREFLVSALEGSS